MILLYLHMYVNYLRSMFSREFIICMHLPFIIPLIDQLISSKCANIINIQAVYIFQCLMQNAGQQYCQGGATSHQNQAANFGHTEPSNTVSSIYLVINNDGTTGSEGFL